MHCATANAVGDHLRVQVEHVTPTPGRGPQRRPNSCRRRRSTKARRGLARCGSSRCSPVLPDVLWGAPGRATDRGEYHSRRESTGARPGDGGDHGGEQRAGLGLADRGQGREGAAVVRLRLAGRQPGSVGAGLHAPSLGRQPDGVVRRLGVSLRQPHDGAVPRHVRVAPPRRGPEGVRGPDGPAQDAQPFTGRVRWVQLDIEEAAEDVDHLITREERLRIAMARQ